MTAAKPADTIVQSDRSLTTEHVPAARTSAVMGNSLAGSVWTVVSRLTGMARVLVVGAVLGATFLGNTYQTLNSLPNLVFYQFLAGSLFASLLVPPLVRLIDRDDRAGARKLVNGFMGTLLLVAAVLAGILVALSPVIMRLLTIGADPVTAAAQRRAGFILLALFVPQILCYAVVGTAAAVMNAHGRFALAAGAPAIESLGIIAVFGAVALVFGTSADIGSVSSPELLLLGLGTTAAVAIHALCQWLGARGASAAAPIPRLGWKDPEVRDVLRRVGPTLGYSAVSGVQLFAVMVAANLVSGGFVAFNAALNFYYLPIAIVTWPLGRALLPELSRLHHEGNGQGFRDESLRGFAVATTVTVPLAAACLALSPTLARVIAFGRLDTTVGVTLIAVSLATLTVGVVFETWFILGSYAMYARYDVRSPLYGMAIKVGASLLLMIPAFFVHGEAVLAVIGVSLTVSSLIGAAYIGRRWRRDLPRGGYSPAGSLVRATVAGAALVAVSMLTIRFFPGQEQDHLREMAALVVAGGAGLLAYLGVQYALRAPEIEWLRSGLSSMHPLRRGAR